MGKSDRELSGLGGWLVVLGITLILAPERLMTTARATGKLGQLAPVTDWIKRASDAYEFQWAAFVWIGTVPFVVATLFIPVLLLLFFCKHRTFPVVLAGYLFALILIMGARFYLITVLPNTTPEFGNKEAADATLTILGGGAWLAYLFKSRRVHLTFKRRFYLTPTPPFFTTI